MFNWRIQFSQSWRNLVFKIWRKCFYLFFIFLFFLSWHPQGALFSYSFHSSRSQYIIVCIVQNKVLLLSTLYNVMAESMMSSSLCDLHWSQIRSTLPAFLAPRSYLLCLRHPSPNSRSGVHRLSLWGRYPMRSCAGEEFAWRHPENWGCAN